MLVCLSLFKQQKGQWSRGTDERRKGQRDRRVGEDLRNPTEAFVQRGVI